MATIGFIGLGQMGVPMVQNLLKAGHAVSGFDTSRAAMERFAGLGGVASTSVDVACMGAEFVITMLPAAEQVREVYLGRGGVLASAAEGTLLIDCSSVDVDTARAVVAAADVNGLAMVDAPVTGSVADAETGALTFLVGGKDASFERAKPILEAMGKTISHTGASGSGQAANLCNKMILGVSMIVVSEAFVLAERLGLDPKKLFEIASTSYGQCWALTSGCPVADLVPSAPANRDYQAGISAASVLNELQLARETARSVRAPVPLTAGAAAVYQPYVEGGAGASDLSGIIRFLREAARK